MFSEANQKELSQCDALFRQGQDVIKKVQTLESEFAKANADHQTMIREQESRVDEGIALLEESKKMESNVRNELRKIGQEMMNLLDRFQSVAEIATRDHQRLGQLEAISGELMSRLGLKGSSRPAIENEKDS